MTEQPTAATEPDAADEETTTDVALPDEDLDAGTLEVFPPHQTPVLSAQVMLHQHARMMADAYKFADGICYTSMVPDQYRGKPKEGAAAILYGAEIGLNPIASLQKVINVHGTPGLEARTMKGILKSKGFKFRTVTKTETEYEIHAWEPDSDWRNDPPDEIGHWTIERARQAEYCPVEDPATGTWKTFTKRNGDKATLGNMKYITDPIGMLEAKGTADVCRAIAPEILLGLPYATEELSTERWNTDDDHDDDRRPEPAPTRAKGTAALRDRAKKAKAKAEPKPEPVDAEEVALPDEVVADLVTETTLPVDEPTVPDQPPADTSPAPPTAEPTPDVAPEPVPDTTPADAPEPTPVPDIAPEPAPVVTPDPAPAEPVAKVDTPADDMEMSPAVRSKGVDMLNGLLINGGLSSDEYRADALSEISAKRPGAAYRRIDSVDRLTNTELKFMVDTLRAWKAQSQLESWIGEAVNNASLREAGMLPDEAQA